MYIKISGNDHSPWVESVLLAVHKKRVPHSELVLPPPGLFFNSGILMPAVKIDSHPWQYNSEQIAVELSISEVSDADRAALQRTFRTALERADSAREVIC